MIFLGNYLNTSTANVAMAEIADSQNDALVTSLALAVA
jgi:hypothetical protein